MANPSKAKGTRAETRVVNHLTAHGLNAERKALKGNKDEGDIQMRHPDGSVWMSLEVKTGKMTQDYSRKQLDGWLDQARVEGINCDQQCHLVIVRYGRKLCDAEVWWKIGDIRRMIYLDEWIKSLETTCH